MNTNKENPGWRAGALKGIANDYQHGCFNKTKT
jgi:hypothetical protein